MIAPEIKLITQRLKEQGYHITIETAATVPPEAIRCDLASLSPKLTNSLPDERLPATWRERHAALRWQPDVVKAWIQNYAYQFKFVVSAPADLDEIEGLLSQLGEDIPRSKVLLMPEGTTQEKLRDRSAWLGELCKTRGYRYAHRLHIELYGNKRGT